MFASTTISVKHVMLSAAAAGAVVVALAISAAPASAQNASVRSACAGDYQRFCPSYAVGSTQLRSCMRGMGRRLSPGCVDALVDSGEVSRKELKGRR